jgi:phosphoribosylamine--glycine ligase
MSKIMIVGSGGRENAIAWKIAQSPNADDLWLAPGNGGSEQFGERLKIKANNIEGLVSEAKKLRPDLVFVGPEEPLSLGLIDYLNAENINAIGPTKVGSQIETSKIFAKALMDEAGIPTAKWSIFTNFRAAKEHILKNPIPIVIKADGLASGKGVSVCNTREEAIKFIEQAMVEKIFGSAGEKIIIEEALSGREASIFVLCDGENFSVTVPACDYKRVGNEDTGPNTGGMGSYSPPEFLNPSDLDNITETIIKPTLKTLTNRGIKYKGILYIGLMMTDTGPKVLEYNCRMGDPETQVVLPRLNTDILSVFEAITTQSLSGLKTEWSPGVSVGVVLASAGYPASPETGKTISGLNNIASDVIAFHSGTEKKDDVLLTTGGRVMTLVATGRNITETREKLYKEIEKIHFEGMQYRSDIAKRAELIV